MVAKFGFLLNLKNSLTNSKTYASTWNGVTLEFSRDSKYMYGTEWCGKNIQRRQSFQLSDSGQTSLSQGGLPWPPPGKVAFPPLSHYPVIFSLSTNHSQMFSVLSSLKYLLEDSILPLTVPTPTQYSQLRRHNLNVHIRFVG